MKKGRKLWAVLCLAVLVLSSYAVASAAEDKTMIIEEGRHSICVFGQSVVLITGEEMEIIPNNETKLVDIMVDGQVSKGLEQVTMQSLGDGKLILEEGSLIVKCSSKEQADKIREMIAQLLNMPGQTLKSDALGLTMDKLKGLIADKIYVVNKDGKIVDEDGQEIYSGTLPADVSSVVQQYQSFSGMMEEKKREEQEQAVKEAEERDKKVPTPIEAPTEAPAEDSSETPSGTPVEPTATPVSPTPTTSAAS